MKSAIADLCVSKREAPENFQKYYKTTPTYREGCDWRPPFKLAVDIDQWRGRYCAAVAKASAARVRYEPDATPDLLRLATEKM
ncbi:unnamed protein product [Pieris macdunnoughi]|uniref:Uncharacterized protein n=1 Tax=Pieris macdunnoughi TaxID=345717 RepID=A0A821ST10_9NEOP|nr:unnamed protein product [Pieris macdunnoughi]